MSANLLFLKSDVVVQFSSHFIQKALLLLACKVNDGVCSLLTMNHLSVSRFEYGSDGYALLLLGSDGHGHALLLLSSYGHALLPIQNTKYMQRNI